MRAIHAYEILVGEPEGKSPLRGPQNTRQNNINIIFKEVKCKDIDCIHVVEEKDHRQALENIIMNPWFP